jgi:N-acyl amino acid synthase of PEP-CTERM/exosortase system
LRNTAKLTEESAPRRLPKFPVAPCVRDTAASLQDRAAVSIAEAPGADRSIVKAGRQQPVCPANVGAFPLAPLAALFPLESFAPAPTPVGAAPAAPVSAFATRALACFPDRTMRERVEPAACVSYPPVASFRPANGNTSRPAHSGRAPRKTMRQLKHTLEADGGLSPALFELSQTPASLRFPTHAYGRTRVPEIGGIATRLDGSSLRPAVEPTRLADRFQCDFFERFSLELANTEELLDESYRLRYQVYVDELKFERQEDFPDGREHDHYDPRSIVVLLRHRESQQCVGCVRLIVADPQDIEQPFPFELAAAEQITLRSELFRQTPRRRIGEVSRLAVTGALRRRRLDDQLTSGTTSHTHYLDNAGKHSIPPALGLVFAAAWLGLEIGLEAVFVMMELRLARLLRQLGIKFRQVAEPVEYHGLRAPFEILTESLRSDDVPPHLRSALDLVRQKTLALYSSLDSPLMRVAQPLC